MAKQRICPQCGKDFTDERRSNNQIYCSTKCGRNAEKEKRIESIKKREHYHGKYKVEIMHIYRHKCAACGWAAIPDPDIVNGKFYWSCGNDIHHITQVSDGGTNNTNNLIVLCPNCHKLAHMGLITKEELQKLADNAIASYDPLERQMNSTVERTIGNVIFK